MKINRFAALALLLCAGSAFAQTQPWRSAGEGHSISVSSSASVPVQLTPFTTDASCTQVTLHNTGGTDAYVELASTGAAAVPDIPASGNPGSSWAVQAGTRIDVATPNKPYISAKTSSGSTTVVAVCSTGALRGTTGVLLGTGTSSTQVQGTAADGAAAVGSPVQVGGKDGSGNVQALTTDTSGNIVTVIGSTSTALNDAASNSQTVPANASGSLVNQRVFPQVFNGTTWDRIRGDATNGLKVYEGAPAAASILAGSQSYTATQAATTIITIPAGNSWVGQVTINADVAIAAASATAGQALGVVTTVGAGTTPAAGQVFDCEARSGANAATGTVGSSAANSCTLDMIINCASGTCTIAGATTQAGTASRVSFSASGRLY